jgi:hypothetical protein
VRRGDDVRGFGVVTGLARSARLVARGREDAVVVDGDVVLTHGGRIHRLNPTAARVWAGCDGRTDLGTLARDLAAAHRADVTAVEPDVLRVASELVALDVLVDADAPALSIPVIEPVASCSGCGPGPTYEWHVLVAVDDGLLAIGADAAVAGALTEVLAARVAGVLEAPETRASYGVVVPEVAQRGEVQDVARLHRGPDVLARSRRPATVLRALLTQIGAHACPGDLAIVEAVAVGSAGGVVLLPGPLRTVAFERSAAAAGLAVAGSGLAFVEPGGTVVVGAPWLDVAPDALDAVASGRADSDRAAAELPWGRYEPRAMATTAPGAGRAVGELGPGAPFAAGPAALDTVLRAAAVALWVEPTPGAIARALRAPA